MRANRNHPHLINNTIQAAVVQVLDESRRRLGEMPLKEALGLARGQELDLIMVALNAQPPVCLISDYGRFLFRRNKRDGVRRTPCQKEIQLSATISEHDLKVKTSHARELLAGGHPVRVTLKLRGRQAMHPEVADHQMRGFLAGLGAHPHYERTNGTLHTTLHPGKFKDDFSAS